MKTKPKPKKRNPQDSTRRNVQAANKRIKHLETCYRFLDERIVSIQKLLKQKEGGKGDTMKWLKSVEVRLDFLFQAFQLLGFTIQYPKQKGRRS